jgi:hypothetical protein
MLNITVAFIHFAPTFRTFPENQSINNPMFNIKKLRG